jgi:hypothetical protein
MRFLLAVLALLTVAACPVQAADVEHPLGKGQIELSPTGLVFRARWNGPAGPIPMPIETATLRVSGGSGEGDTGLIQLQSRYWHSRRGGRLLLYTDPSRSGGGVRKIVVRFGKRRGQVTVTGGRPGWRYRIERPHTEITLTLTIGAARFCAEFERRHLRNSSRRVRGISKRAPAACRCGAAPASTWEAIQANVFASHGCTQAVCHGSAPGQGNLDLRPEAAYANLVDVASSALPSQKRVEPGDPKESLLWRKLAARTQGLAGVPLSPMPSGDAVPLSEDELRLVELWIQNGAPARGTVPGTEELLTCVPPPTPIKIRPPARPAAGAGVQLYSPPWPIPPRGEDEVCFATWFDFSREVPAELQRPCPPEWGGPAKQCFLWNRAELTQDPNSHHSIPRIYRGEYDLSHPGFGTFTCHGGALDGQPCSPKAVGTPAPAGADCGVGGGCAGTVVSAVACIGFGPPDLSQGLRSLADSEAAPYIAISTEPLSTIQYPPGVSAVLPLQGILVVNSHAFNVTAEPTTNEQWLNLYFSGPDDRRYLVQSLFDANDIFVQYVPAFEQREYCRTRTFDEGTRLFHLTTHTHKRGKLFRVWGPGVAAPCSSATTSCLPEPGTPILTTTDYADPAQLTFDPPLVLDGGDAASRTFKYCALYDNGFTDPGSVKRASVGPPGAQSCTSAEISCLAGPHRGEPCGGSDAACDSSRGAGDGRCDACPLRGGVTTEDEMLVLLGSYYCVEGATCYQPLQ